MFAKSTRNPPFYYLSIINYPYNAPTLNKNKTQNQHRNRFAYLFCETLILSRFVDWIIILFQTNISMVKLCLWGATMGDKIGFLQNHWVKLK